MKGLPTGYNKDLQEDKEPLFDAEDTLAVSLDADRRRRFASSRCTPSAPAGPPRVCCSQPTSPTTWSSRGMPFRQAHEVVGAMVRQLLAEGRDFEALSARRMAGVQPAVRRRCEAAGHGRGLGAGPPDAAIDQSRRGSAPRWPTCGWLASCVAWAIAAGALIDSRSPCALRSSTAQALRPALTGLSRLLQWRSVWSIRGLVPAGPRVTERP